ncbi:dihydropteroate synthase [Bernardetia litoralis DSM 6794]|uniref:dihydropteroate synthase n=1 Tax=Bernardetia litoralis (strain ATCC 23117 / DSM 6794 / NBRC 15988 / NCIMB 1366 / Fx l1 / Sio-4) TaxID=880071 RepID=I4AJ01_BERLS|nr:dihydropteroate synthase [Bernardetia litoralis]AFM03936.1 dihydropteroate synthase [Bernardetia litoralis DSM 6794]
MQKNIPTLHIKNKLISLQKPIVMGILNVTPDSFYEESRINTDVAILKKASQMLEEGATILDIGGYSTRPDADDIPIEEEIKRVVHPISVIKKEFPNAIISIDTFRSKVAREAINAGADLINDVSGGNLDTQMFETVASLKVPYILMHMRGTPQTMKTLTDYENIIAEMMTYFQSRITTLKSFGVEEIILDLGFGFAKTIDQNYFLLKNLAVFEQLEFPILAGISRKSMIYKKLDISVSETLNGTSVLNTIALQNGAKILRVHDVKEAMEAIQLLEYLK